MSCLVTGAGGFIGSALVRAIGPESVIALDSCEQNLFDVQSEAHEAVLGSVCDASLIEELFARFRPEIVYHAAAFKHVPLLESNPFAAVQNNTMGTYVVADAARRHGAKLVLVSTDKAVNPCSMLGFSKRLAERMVVSMGMSVVRLVNVIGSPGSVLPLFMKHIAAGGPVTVTHPEATRWFLSRREAVDAILAGGAAECAGRILIPQMRDPVRIADIAEYLIGGAAVEIRFTGLRPGEKLTEELIAESETIEGASGPLKVVRTAALAPSELCALVERLSTCLATRDLPGLMQAMQ
jgi:FlaA1/EpsC-like NDP-sugar epimerase